MKDWIDDFIGFLDDTIKKLKNRKYAGAEIRALQKDKKTLKEIRDLFYQALEETKSVGNTRESGDDVRYSVKEFAEQVDQIEAGTFPRGNHVYVGATPKILADIGLNGNLPMLTTAQHIRKAMLPKNDKTHQHGLTEAQIKALPQKIANPVMIMDSLDPSRNAVIVVTDMMDADGSPIIAAIKADGRGMFNDVEVDTNFVLSYYGRDGFHNFIDKNISADTFLYIDKTKSRSLSNQAKRQFFGKLDKYDFDIIIRKTNANVNVLNSENISKNKEQAQYADNVNKFSIKDIENYSETEYNQYGWAVVNDVLSRTEYRKLNEQFAAIAHGGKFGKTKDGYYVIPVGEDDRPQNAFVFIKGTISKPVIGQIMIIDVDNEMALDRIRRNFGDGGIYESLQFAEYIFGSESVVGYQVRDFKNYRELREQRTNMRRGVRGDQGLSESGRGNRDDQEAVRRDNQSGQGRGRGRGENRYSIKEAEEQVSEKALLRENEHLKKWSLL